MSNIIDGLKAEAGGSPYLGELAYEAFWQVALSTGAVEVAHVPFEAMPDQARWAWHAAAMAAVRYVQQA